MNKHAIFLRFLLNFDICCKGSLELVDSPLSSVRIGGRQGLWNLQRLSNNGTAGFVFGHSL